MSDDEDNFYPLNSGPDLPLSTVLWTTAPEREIVDSLSALQNNYAPTEGRMAKVSSTGDKYIGDGSSWNKVDSTTGLEAHRGVFTTTDTDDLSINNLGVSAGPTSDQTVSNTTFTTVNLDTVLFDDRSEIDTANNKVVISETGRYRVSGSGKIDVGDSNRAIIRITANGSRIAEDQETQSGTSSAQPRASRTVSLADGDEIQLVAYQDSGGDATLKSNTVLSYLEVVRVA